MEDNMENKSNEVDAKRTALRKMKKELKGENKNKEMGVTVKAKNKEGLLKGLDKAEEIIKKPEVLEELAEKAEEREEAEESLSQEEIKEQIAKLKEMLED